MALLAGLLLAGVIPRQAAAQATADPYIPSASDFGGVGLLQTRTARFGPDGQMDIGYSEIAPYERYLITVQALPWLEATFRYTSVQDRDFQGNANVGLGSSFKDRGADLKFKLFSETRYFPQVALGLQDGLGTGIFAGEYLALSKRFYDLDFTLGMGWGAPAGAGMIRNPLISLSDQFRTRGAAAGQGGNLTIGNYFHGEFVGLFGGVEYTTPIRGVSLKLEYDPNDYKNEPLNSQIEATSHWNFGVNYRPFSWIDLSVAYERGNAFMGRVSLRGDLHSPGLPKFDPPPPQVQVRPAAPALAEDPGMALPETWPNDAEARDSLDLAQFESALRGRGFRPAWVARDGNDPVVMFEELVTPAIAQEVVRIAAQTGLSARRVLVMGSDGRTEIVEISTPPPAPNLDPLFAALDMAGGRLQSIDLMGGRPRVTLEEPVAPDAAGQIAGALFVAVPDGGPIVEIRDAATGQVQAFRRAGAQPAAPGVRRMAAAPQAPLRSFSLRPLTAEEKADAAEAMIAALEEERFLVDAIDFEPPLVTVYLSPRRFRQPARNIGRAAIAIANTAPPQIEDMTLVLLAGGLETGRVTLHRTDLENAAGSAGSPEEIWAKATIEGPKAEGIPATAYRNDGRYPNFSYSFRPQVRQHIGGGDQFFLYQVYAALTGNVQVTQNWSFSTTVGKDIYNNFDRLKVEPQRTLPPVRSDIKKYLQQGEDNIVRMQANGLWTLAPDLYGRVSTGIFEEMYGGIGGEILYRPFGARFAVGADLNYVRQRNYDQMFTFLDYKVKTGHLNMYYQLPIYDLLGIVSVGQYLAGDKGATFQLSRRFESGIQAGVFFTLTDVPFEVFGEGSFDKGFFIAVPFDLFSTRSGTTVGSFGFRPLTKDGGQRLSISPRLYDITSGGSLDSIARDWGRILD